MICEKCGAELKIGSWPFCKGAQNDHAPGMFGFDPFQSYVDEHILSDGKDIGPNLAGEIVQGTRIDTRSERRKIMKEEGLEWKGRKYGSRTHPEF